jgi:Ca-activated chloride channel family protein
MVCSPNQVGADQFGGMGGFPGGGFGGRAGGFRGQEIDEDALQQVADTTGGRYFRAEDSDQLAGVLNDLPREIGLHKQKMEITVWFVLAGALLVLTGLGLALWWNRGPAQPRPIASPQRSRTEAR